MHSGPRATSCSGSTRSLSRRVLAAITEGMRPACAACFPRCSTPDTALIIRPQRGAHAKQPGAHATRGRRTLPVRVVLPRRGGRSRRPHAFVPPSVGKRTRRGNAITNKRAGRLRLPRSALGCGRACAVGLVSDLGRPHGQGACGSAPPLWMSSVPGRIPAPRAVRHAAQRGVGAPTDALRSCGPWDATCGTIPRPCGKPTRCGSTSSRGSRASCKTTERVWTSTDTMESDKDRGASTPLTRRGAPCKSWRPGGSRSRHGSRHSRRKAPRSHRNVTRP